MRLDVYGDGTLIKDIERPAVIVASKGGEPLLLNYGEYDKMKEYMGNYRGLQEEFSVEPKLIDMVNHKDFQDIIVSKKRFREYFKVV